MMLEILRIKPDALLPRRGTEQSIGLDLHAYLISETGRASTLILAPYSTRLISTGLIMKPPSGHSILVCSRSGLALRSIFVTNAPGVIDPDYRGEIKVLLYNGSPVSQYIKHEDRVAQILILPTPIMPFEEVTTMDLNTPRGDAGFGSTGQ